MVRRTYRESYTDIHAHAKMAACEISILVGCEK